MKRRKVERRSLRTSFVLSESYVRSSWSPRAARPELLAGVMEIGEVHLRVPFLLLGVYFEREGYHFGAVGHGVARD